MPHDDAISGKIPRLEPTDFVQLSREAIVSWDLDGMITGVLFVAVFVEPSGDLFLEIRLQKSRQFGKIDRFGDAFFATNLNGLLPPARIRAMRR
jgi:hypothetical protein